MHRIGLAAVAAVAFMASARPAAADNHAPLQFRLEAALCIMPRSRIPLLEGLMLYQPPEQRFGVFIMANGTTGAASAFLGPMLIVNKWLTLGAGPGFELANLAGMPHTASGVVGTWHVGFVAHLDHPLVQAHAVFEYGPVLNLTHRSEINVLLDPAFGLGAFVGSEAGVGPRFEVRIPGTGFALWGAPTYSWALRSAAGVLALRLNY
jgi:hypothetical protein